MAITHQEIIDRLEALGIEHSKAYQIERDRIAKERKSLEELCGGLGHTFAQSRSPFGLANGRFCLFCNCPEPGKVG